MSESRDHLHPYSAGDEVPPGFDDALAEARRIIPVDQEPVDSPCARRAARLLLAGVLYGFQQLHSRRPRQLELAHTVRDEKRRCASLNATPIGQEICRKYRFGISNYLQALSVLDEHVTAMVDPSQIPPMEDDVCRPPAKGVGATVGAHLLNFLVWLLFDW